MTQNPLRTLKLASLLACAALTYNAFAADGKWNADAADNWGTASRWTNSQVASGIGAVADISFNITAARTITLTTPVTVGVLRFEDATTSSHEWTLAGSGANILTLQVASGTPTIEAANRTPTINAQVAGTQGLQKTGTGTLCLNNAVNLYTGKTTASAGTLRINTALSLGPVPATYVADQLTLSGGATLMNNNSEPVIAANQGITLGTGGGRIQAGWSKLITINSPITGAGNLTIANDTTPGVISLNAENTYTGTTTVGSSGNNWAICLVNGSLGASSAVAVTVNGWLGGNGVINGPISAVNGGILSAGARFQAGTLTVSNNVALTNCVLSLDLGNATTEGGGVNDLLNVYGDLALSGTVTVNVLPIAGSLAQGTYRLVNYSGALLGAANFVTAPSRYTLVVDTNTPGQINLVVTGSPVALAWKGAASPVWDINASPNWLNGANTSVFLQGDNVVFDDTGSYTFNINMAPAFDSSMVTLVPGSVSITTSNDLTLSSVDTTYGGRLAGPMGLYKGGAGTLTLNNGNGSMPNYYDGPTVITNGILKVGHARALGTIAGGTYATNGGTLDINAQNIAFEPVVIEGVGKGGLGALVNNAADQQNAIRVLTLAGDATVGGSGRFDLRGSPADTFLNSGGQPFKLTKRGPQQFSLVGVTVDPALGDIDIAEGTMSYESSTTSLGDPSKKLTVAPEGQLLFWGAANPLNKVLAFNGGARENINVGSGSNTIVGPVTVNAESRWVIGGTSLAVYSGIDGSGGITKSGASPLYLYGTNIYSGSTLVNAGKIVLGTNALIGNSSTLAVSSGATLDVSAAGLKLSNGQTLSGSGTVQGNVTAPAGSILAPGTGAGAGTLTISGDLALDNAAATIELGADPAGTGNDLLKANSIAATGVTAIKIVPQAALATGTPYTLFQVTGPVLASGTETNFSVSSDTRYGFTLVPTDTSGGGSLQAQVSGTGAPAQLVWTGNDAANPTFWDTRTTTNWLNGAAGDTFYGADSVVFNDRASGAIVNLIGTVQPGLLALANSQPFTFGGSGSVLASALTADGTAATSIGNSAGNAFVYGITNNSGALTFANAGPNNFGAGLTVNNGSVTLANTAGNTLGTVAVNGGSLLINNNAVNTFSGVVGINGTLTFDQPLATTLGNALTGSGQLVKNGANTLTLSAASGSFTGTIRANNGTLRVGNAAALGDAAGTTTIANGAGFDVNGQTLGFESMVVSGAGPDGLGVIVNRGAAQQNAFRKITLGGNATFGAPVNRWDIRSDDVAVPNGSLSTDGNAYNLTKLGPAEVWIVSTTVDPELGDVNIVQGTLGYENMTTGLGNPAKTLTIYPNATLGFYNSANPLDKRIVIKNGGRVSASNSTRNAIAGPISIPDGLGIFDIASGVTLTSSNEISGDGILLKQNTGTLILNATNTLTGNIVVNGGTLIVSNSLAMGTNKVVAVNYTTATTGGSGVQLSLRGGITSPEDVVASFTAVNTNAMDMRCSMASAALANTWAGPILLNGNNIVGFYGAVATPLTITGPIYGTNGFSGTAFFRGAAGVCGSVLNSLIAPSGIMNITDNSVWLFDSPSNVWARTAISYGRFVLGTDNAAYPGAELVLGQSGTSSGTLDLNGFNQTVPAISTINGNNHLIGNGSTTADSLFTFNGGANVSSLDGHIVDRVGSGTRKLSLTVQAGSLTLLATNSYTGDTIIAGGTLGIGANGTIASTPLIDLRAGATLNTSAKTAGLILASGQTLKGNGTVAGSISIGNGATLSAGASIGALTVNNTLTFVAGGTNVAELNKSATPSSDLVNAASVVYGGNLVLVNLGADLALGDSFKLFNATAYSGAFDTIVPATPGNGLVWDTSKLAIDGTLSVKTSMPSTPTTITALLSGNTLTLGWPSDYIGWQLEAQTNALTLGLSTNWVIVPGSTVTNQMSFPVDPAQPTVFYRLGTPTP